MRDGARSWLLKSKFARVEHGSLRCTVCRRPMQIVVKTRAGE